VVQSWPKAEHAVWAQADLIKSYLAQDNDASADAAVEKLLTNFNDNPLIARAVWDTGQYYRDLKKYEMANKLYQHVVKTSPESEHALWAQADLIKSYLALGDDPNAQAAVDKLLTEFAHNKLIARAIHDTAWEYRKSGNYGRANELDKYVIDNWPADMQVMWAKMDMAKTDILLGNDAAAEKTIDILIVDFNDNPELPRTILIIGEEYYKKGLSKEDAGLADQAKDCFEKAVKMWGRLINKFPNSALIPETCCWAGDCYHKLGQYEKSMQCFQKVVNNWPDYQYAWHAQFMVGRNMESLKESGVLSESEANPKIRAAYERVIQNYPDCSAAGYANNWLSQEVKVEKEK